MQLVLERRGECVRMDARGATTHVEFTIPARGDAGPGRLAIVFDARVATGASGGRYTLTGQLTDSDGEVVAIDNAAPITVLGPTPPPSPSTAAGGAGGSPPPATPGYSRGRSRRAWSRD